MAVGGFSLLGNHTVSFGSREGAGEGGRSRKKNNICIFKSFSSQWFLSKCRSAVGTLSHRANRKRFFWFCLSLSWFRICVVFSKKDIQLFLDSVLWVRGLQLARFGQTGDCLKQFR